MSTSRETPCMLFFRHLYRTYCSKSDKTLNVYEQYNYTTETWYFQISNNPWVNVYKYLTAEKHNRYLLRLPEIVPVP